MPGFHAQCVLSSMDIDARHDRFEDHNYQFLPKEEWTLFCTGHGLGTRFQVRIWYQSMPSSPLESWKVNCAEQTIAAVSLPKSCLWPPRVHELVGFSNSIYWYVTARTCLSENLVNETQESRPTSLIGVIRKTAAWARCEWEPAVVIRDCCLIITEHLLGYSDAMYRTSVSHRSMSECRRWSGELHKVIVQQSLSGIIVMMRCRWVDRLGDTMIS